MTVFFTIIFEILPFAAAAALIFVVARIIFLAAKKKKPKIGREILYGIFALYIAGLAALTLFPDPFWEELSKFPNAEFLGSAGLMFKGENFASVDIYKLFTGEYVDVFELLFNVILFVPLGFLLPLLNKKLKWWQVDLIGLGATCFIEFFQPIVGRSRDLDDIITNFLGAVIGCGLSKLILLLTKSENSR